MIKQSLHFVDWTALKDIFHYDKKQKVLKERKLQKVSIMETNRNEMCKSLLDWFKVFYEENCVSVDKPEENFLHDLSDGVAIAQALRKLAPDYFTGL